MNSVMDGMNSIMKEHLVRSLSQGLREDGRKHTEYREASIEYGVASTAEGSARVRIGETEVVAGVKLSVEKPFGDQPDDGVVMVGAELLPLSSPEFELGPPSIKAIELARVADRAVREAHAVDTKSLCIESGEKVWFVSVDNCTINDAGNLQDCISLATLAALKDCKFPERNEAGKVEYKKKTKQKLKLVSLPISVTVYKVGDQLLLDPSTIEEAALDARLTIAYKENGKICALQKGGNGALTAEEIGQMTDIALEQSKALRKHLK